MAEAATGGRPKAALGQDRKYYVSEAAVGGRPKAAFILHKLIDIYMCGCPGVAGF